MRRFASLALGILGTSSLLGALSACQGDFMTTVTNFVFPERVPEAIRFPLTSADTGGVYGTVVDASGSAVEGAVVSFGAQTTYTGTGVIRLKDDEEKVYLLPSGDFVLRGIPPRTQTIVTVTYDSVTKAVPVTITATNSFRTAGNATCRPCGLRDLATVSLDLKLPFSPALRVNKVFPTALTATATGSTGNVKLTYEGGSLITFELRNGPKAPAREITSIAVDYLDENNVVFRSATKSVTPVIVSPGTMNTAGANATIQADLADSTIGNTAGNVMAKVRFLGRNPGDSGNGSVERGEDGYVLVRSIPISIKR